MDRRELAQRLIEIPRRIEEAEVKLVLEQQCAEDAKAVVEYDRDRALLGQLEGVVIDGKNAEVREAQLRLALTRSYGVLAEAEAHVADAKIRLHRTMNDFSALKAVARLLSGDNGDE